MRKIVSPNKDCTTEEWCFRRNTELRSVTDQLFITIDKIPQDALVVIYHQIWSMTQHLRYPGSKNHRKIPPVYMLFYKILRN